MSSAGFALLAAAAGVGFAHAVLPDHWVPLAVVGRVKHYSVRRVARLATLAGIAHVLVSLVLGTAIVVIGLQFKSSIEHVQATIVGCILIATGIGFGLLQLSGRGHHHGPGGHTHGPDGHAHAHDHHHDHGHTTTMGTITPTPMPLTTDTAGTTDTTTAGATDTTDTTTNTAGAPDTPTIAAACWP